MIPGYRLVIDPEFLPALQSAASPKKVGVSAAGGHPAAP